jgi:hypothetical protein
VVERTGERRVDQRTGVADFHALADAVRTSASGSA